MSRPGCATIFLKENLNAIQFKESGDHVPHARDMNLLDLDVDMPRLHAPSADLSPMFDTAHPDIPPPARRKGFLEAPESGLRR